MNNSSQPINFADRPLTVAARRSIGLNEDFYDSIQHRTGEQLWGTMAQAMEAGDRTSIRRIAGSYLLHPLHVPLGIGRDRLVLMAASAHADYINVKFLKDLVPYLNAVRAEIDLVRLNDATYGLRAEGVLDNPFEKAEEKAKKDGFKVITLEVRETQHRAIQLYEQAGFVKTGSNPKSVFVNGKYIAGHYYYKELEK